MKRVFKTAIVLALLAASSSLFAGETYGPVLKVKPKGVAPEAGESKPSPAIPQSVNRNQGRQPALLLPAVQKAHEAAPRSGNAGQDEGISGGLDRDLIRRIPGQPKPKPTK